MSGRGQQYGVKVDFYSETLIAIFIVTTLFGGLGGFTGADLASFNLATFLLLMQFSAIALWVVSKTWVYSPQLGKREFSTDSKWILIELASFFLLNIVVPPTVPLITRLPFLQLSLASAGKFVTIMISIPESSLFQGWAAPWFARRTGSELGGAIGSGAAGTIYHFFVYGTSIPQLLIIFGAFTLAGFAVLKTRRLIVALGPHFFNNALSSLLR